MNTIKNAQYLMDNYPDTEVTIFYIDLRAYGKGFEELLMRTRGNGARYIRGLPGDVCEDPETRDLVVKVENTIQNRLEKYELKQNDPVNYDVPRQIRFGVRMSF